MERVWLQHYDNGVPSDFALSSANIAESLDKAVQKYRNRPAVSCLGTTLNYGEWGEAASYFAAYLQKEAGLKKGERIAIMLPNLIPFTVAFYGAQKVGAVCVNTNPLYTPREMCHQFKDSGARVIVIADLFLDKLEQIIKETAIDHVISVSMGDHLPWVKAKVLTTVLKFKKLIPKHNLKVTNYQTALQMGKRHSLSPVSITPMDLALLQYTGGTTGVAKGAMLSHGNILSNMTQIELWIRSVFVEGEEVVLTALPLYHIFALTVNFITLQSMGQHSILVPKPIPIENTIKVFKKYKITVVTGVNTLFNALNNSPEFQKLRPRLKLAAGGGAAVQRAVSESFQQITGVKITEGYGLSEASPVTHFNPLVSERPHGTIGLPMPGTWASIRDESGKEVPIGESGELWIKGPQVMQGYWQKPEESAKALRDGWLCTGDVAKRDEAGFFYIVDRKKDMIIVSGFNVYPNEIEDVIASHPKVLEAAVIGVPHEKTGEAVKAFVVRKDPSLTEEELRTHCASQLTNYKRPRLIEFRDSLPKTNIGKILRRELKAETEKHP